MVLELLLLDAWPEVLHGGPHAFRRPNRRVLEPRELARGVLDARTRVGIHEEGGRVRHERRLARQVAHDIDDVGRYLNRRVGQFAERRAKGLPARTADAHATSDTELADDPAQRPRVAARLPEQAQLLQELDADAEPLVRQIARALVADEQQPIAALRDEQQRFLEARIEAGEELEAGGVFTVGVDDQHIDRTPGHPPDDVVDSSAVLGDGQIGEMRLDAEGRQHDLCKLDHDWPRTMAGSREVKPKPRDAERPLGSTRSHA